MNAFRIFVLGVFVTISSGATLFGQHQTDSFSPVHVGTHLPYEIDLVPYDLGETPLPSVHSYAKAQWDGKWLLIGGRTNGLHAFTQNGFDNFPPAFQNRDVWVIDPVGGESWHRSLEETSAGLSVLQVDSLSVTNNQFAQVDDRLYMTGGYGYQTDFDFVTFDTLTSIDVPGLISWIQGADTIAADHIRQIHDPLFTVTGGAMYAMNGRMHLVFGQDFRGEYTQFGNGVYTNQVRSFSIEDDGEQLAVHDIVMSEPNEIFRRRDLNVVPVIRDDGNGEQVEELRVLSGVFTEAGGAWTVPVEIDSSGNPSMPDSNSPDTFKQAMNGYHSAKLGLYSESVDEMHILLFGGISVNFVDRETQTLIRDDFLPFINQSTAIVINDAGNYEQHLLPNEFPVILDDESGKQLLFGANAEFMISDGISTYENSVIRLDDLHEQTTVGYIFGGIAADQPNRGNTAASGRIFEVVFTPVAAPDIDFDGNGVIDARDINLLTSQMRSAKPDIRFDVDGSGKVDADDLTFLIENVVGTWFGDANLDREFGSADLVTVFQAGEYEDQLPHNSLWETGDWNGDGEFDTSDFVIAFQGGGYEHGTRSVAVPEASPSVAIATLLLALLRGVRPSIG
ncbi:MAG: hypothetical protein KDB27_16035 [Planctomycetales bacterium]|nr:hypothetical protein [Planctomycetales bacterium]